MVVAKRLCHRGVDDCFRPRARAFLGTDHKVRWETMQCSKDDKTRYTVLRHPTRTKSLSYRLGIGHEDWRGFCSTVVSVLRGRRLENYRMSCATWDLVLIINCFNSIPCLASVDDMFTRLPHRSDRLQLWVGRPSLP